MPAFRLKTFPELLAESFAHARAVQITADDAVEPDFNPGSVLRTILEVVCMNDADQYVQIALLRKLFSLFDVTGDDLDARMVELGSEIWTDLRRRPAQTSISQVTVGDGTLLVSSFLAADAVENDTVFDVLTGEGAAFPTSGALVIERGTSRSEEVIYTRTGDTFTIIYPTTGLANGHSAGASVVRISARSTLNGTVLAGAGAATLTAGTGAAWDAVGTIIFERGTAREEKIAFTRLGDAITLGALTTFEHASGTVVIQGTTGTDRTVPSGTSCYAPATDASAQVNFRTLALATLYDGDFASALVDVESFDVGSSTRVGANTITQWASAPFVGATVSNPIAATRGRDREKDGPYLQRALDFLQSQSRGTPLSITTLTSGLRDPVSNRVVEFSQIVEPVAPGESLLYISDGTATFALEELPYAGRDVIIRDADAGDRRGRLSSYGPFAYSTTDPVTPRLWKSINRGAATSVGVNYLEDTGQAMITDYYVGAYLKTDDDQFYEITSNTAIRFNVAGGGATPSLGSYAIVDFGTNPQITSVSTGTAANQLTDGALAMTINAHVGHWLTDSAGAIWEITANTGTVFTLDAGGATPAAGAYTVTAGYPQPLTPGTDFVFNRSNGDLELSVANALVEHDCLVAADDGASPSVGAYTYCDGLGAYIQRVVNGDRTDFDNFPGLRASGTQVRVVTPTIVTQVFVIKVVAAAGFADADLVAPVKTAVQVYVNSLGIGENIILARIVTAVMAVPGVSDCTVLSPLGNVVISDGQLPRIDDSHVGVV